MKKITSILICIQFCVIIVLIYIIYKKHINGIKKVNVNAIKKEHISVNKESTLRYFYEPKVNTKGEEYDSLGPLRAIYNINSDTLNERFDYEINKDDKTFRIVTLGDSFTFGYIVDTKNNWTELLEDKLNQLHCTNFNKIEVINLGVVGYDIQYSVERFKLRGKKYNPDLILWLLKGDDFQEIKEIVQPKWNRINNEWSKLSVPDNVLYAPPLQRAIEEMTNDLGESTILQMQTQFLNEINNYYTGKLILFTFNSTQEKYKSIMKYYSNKRKNTLLYENLIDIYNNQKGATFLPVDYHPNIKGHKLISEDMFNYLVKNKVIPCK